MCKYSDFLSLNEVNQLFCGENPKESLCNDQNPEQFYLIFYKIALSLQLRREVLLRDSQQSTEIGTVANSLPEFLPFFPTTNA